MKRWKNIITVVVVSFALYGIIACVNEAKSSEFSKYIKIDGFEIRNQGGEFEPKYFRVGIYKYKDDTLYIVSSGYSGGIGLYVK
jgi:hypothetical protein